MKMPSLLLGLWTNVLVLCLFFNFSASFGRYDDYADDPSVFLSYNRLAEIEKQCKPFLSSASVLGPDDTRGYRLKNEISLFNGEWEQEIGGSLLMPFDDCDIARDNSSLNEPSKLVNFEVIDVNLVGRWKNVTSLIGVLSIGITRNRSFHFDMRMKFHIRPGISVLSILFEGVYIESEEERLLCMLGNSTLLSTKLINDPSDLSKGYWSSQDHYPRLLQDDQILLVLRYPQTFNLTRRVILGEMTSLHDQGSLKYFDKVHIISHLSRNSKYQFSSELLKSITCSPYVYQEELMEDGTVNMLNGLDFCSNLKAISNEPFLGVPSWKFKDNYPFQGKWGPFQLGKEMEAANQSFNYVILKMEHMKCEQGTSEDGFGTAKVSAAIRAILTSMDNHRPSTRARLSGMTLFAEGVWNSSSGQLCMIGCLGVVDSGVQGCDSQISLYFPRMYSIKQRGLIYGSISSKKDENSSYLPIIFDAVIQPGQLRYDYYEYVGYLSYNYSKIDLASALWKQKQPSKFCTIVKQLLLRYPAVKETGESLASLDSLHDYFEIDTYAVPDAVSGGQNSKIFVFMDVLSLGPLFGLYEPWLRTCDPPSNFQTNLSKNKLLNVSMHLLLTKERLRPRTSYNNLSELYLEGIYDPLVGQMFLIGCRKVMIESTNLERGLDCLIEVNIEYPPITAAWLINPTAKIIITSQRKEDDPLYFSSVSLKTLPLRYKKHCNVSFRKTFEEILRNLMLCMSISFILCQFLHMKGKKNAIPYISLVMLGLQILGYGLPLISGAEILFKWKESEYFKTHPDGLDQLHPSVKVLEYTAKLFLLSAFLLSAKLFHKVSASQRRSHARGPTFKRVPNNKLVLLVTLIFHNFGFLLLLTIDSMLHPERDSRSVRHVDMLQNWMIKLEDYMELVQDFFLLPQILGNFLWYNHVKSLSRLYYIGFTLVRLLLRTYNCIRDPWTNPAFEDVDFGVMNAALFTKACNIAAVVAMIVLAITVHLQQNWKHRKVSSH